MSLKEEIQILEKLGLTLSQSRVYLAMFNLVNPTARDLYKNVSVARQDVYRILSELEDLNLVERLLGKPMRFRPTPIKNALSMLLDQKYDETLELKKWATEVFVSSKKWVLPKRNVLSEQSFELGKVYSHDPRVKASFESTNEVVRLLEGRIYWPIFSSFVGAMERLLDRGVKIRVLTDSATGQQKMPEFMKVLRDNPFFEIRFLQNLLATNLLLLDEKEVAVWSMTPASSMREKRKTQVLWSTHYGLVKLASNYFEVLWSKASNVA